MTSGPRAAGLVAALGLAVGRAAAAEALMGERPAVHAGRAWHAFLALPASLPLFLLVQGSIVPGAEMPVLRPLAGVVLGWLAYAVLSERMAAATGRAALWPRFVMLWNWCNLVQYLFLVLALVPGWLGVPAAVAQGVWLVAVFWAVWLQWSATRLGLAIGGGPAALLVVADMTVGVLAGRLVGD